LLVTAAILAGCGGSGARAFQPSRWISADPARETVILTLRVHGNGVSLGDINGYARGQVLVQIPVGWRVIVRCRNDSSAQQSCAIVKNSLSTAPALPGAATRNPTEGLAPGSAASFSFFASPAGVYRIASLCDDEEIGNGTWDGLQIGGTPRPSVTLARKIP
jgi:hypothetical protein